MLLSKLLALFPLDYAVGAVALVAHEYLSHILVGVLIYLLKPVRDVVEGLLICRVIDQYNAHCTLVVGLCDRAEALLPCCVPHL